MKLLLLLTILTTQSFAKLNAYSKCPEGQVLERFSPELKDQYGERINQYIYLCVISIKPCETISKKTILKSKLTNSEYQIIEGFKCSYLKGMQCQQQQQHHRYQTQRQQNQSHGQREIKVHSLKTSKAFGNVHFIKSGDYVKFDNKMYKCQE